jgi:tetratricopeptide (TPR) repeat protein
VVAASPDSRRQPVLVVLLSWGALPLMLVATLAEAAEPSSCKPVARVVSIQGALQIQRAGETDWTYLRRLDATVCEGDLLHTGASGRAALLLSPETLFRVQQNSTVAIRQSAAETVVEYTISEVRDPVRVAPNPCGAGYFITRFPRKFRVLTPFANASVEGTEFLVALSCQSTTVAVFEGRVLAQQVLTADSTVFSLEEGQQITAGGAEPPAVKLLVKPVDAVQWALYYPPLTQPAGEAAADQPCEQPGEVERGQCLLQRAEQRLRIGRVEEAEADLEALSRLAPSSGEPYAQRSIIRLTKNDKAEALALAQRAVDLSPESARAWLALSYAHQAAFDLDKALEAAQKSAALDPNSSTVQARVAELLMSLGRIREAEKAASAAVTANANDSRAHAVLGFVHLAQIDTKAARENFLAAIERDSADPLPRLGLGLAIIREGDLAAGREQIEIAVVLDPTNSLVRSYAGKAYYEENTKERDQLAAKQFAIAKELDPKDPTPWFYDAILKQTQNLPVASLEQLQGSIERNDNRAVYRSRLLLDEDAATRSTGLARIYRSLGFEQLGVSVAGQSLEDAPANHSAHRFLSDTFASLPRHEIARASELLQSKLLRPVSGLSYQPCLIDADSTTRRPAVPDAGFAELTSMFERDKPHIFASALVGEDDRSDLEANLAGSTGRMGYGLLGCHHQDYGFRENEEYRRAQYSGLLQYSPLYGLNLQAEVQHDDRDFGDITYNFDPTLFSTSADNQVEIDTARFGLHYQVSPASHLLLSMVSSNRTNTFSDAQPGEFDFNREVDLDSLQLEAQFIGQLGRAAIILGAGGGKVDSTDSDSFNDYLTPFSFEDVRETRSEQTQIYAYTHVPLSSTLTATIGATYDKLEDNPIDESYVNPKVGVRWAPSQRFSIRAAAFRSARRFLVQNQTIEPTSIAGFNQFFDDYSGSRTERYGVGVDAMPLDWLFAGVEASRRELDVPTLVVEPTGERWVFEPQRENLLRGYLYARLSRVASLSIEPWYEDFSRDVQLDFDFLANEVRTTQVPVTLRLAFPQGWAIALTGRYTKQEVDRLPTFRTLYTVGTEEYFVADVSIAYRFRRSAVVNVEVKNIGDQAFLYQDDNIIRRSELTPTGIFPQRTAWVRVAVQF